MPDMRTLGAEEELHVLDLESGRLSARAPELLRGLPDEGFAFELQRSTVETNTRVCETLAQLGDELARLRGLADAAAAKVGLGVAACGSAPLSGSEDFELTSQGRYSRMQQDYRYLVDDQLICGLQVHVGVSDRDLAVRVSQRVARDLPTLLAMSASSAYWHGKDTGYASFRTIVWQRWPTSGSIGFLETAEEYDTLLHDLIRSGVISDVKMAYFDVRPSTHVPTVELRVCDACPLVEDAVLVAALFRALVERAVAEDARGEPLTGRPGAVYRAAMWRAARSGLSGALLAPTDHPDARPAADVVRALVDGLRAPLEEAGDWDDVGELVKGLLGRGDASSRQRRRLAERGRVADVARLVLAETRGEVVGASPVLSITADYPQAPADDALAQTGVPYPAYRRLFAALDDLGLDELEHRTHRALDRATATGFTYGSEGRPFPVDLVPRIVAPHEWAVLATGLTQRARAIELFLRDVYGPARIVAEGVVDEATLRSSPGWSDDAAALPKGVVNAPVIGFDLVRDSLSGWRVLEDNTRVPSGVGYAIGLRRLMREVLPEVMDGVALRDPASALDMVGATLRASAHVDNPIVALLSDGADNSAWYEHRLIAREAGFLLVQPNEVEYQDGRIWAGGRRLDLIYLRLGVELADLQTRAGYPIGRRILDVAKDGRVRVVNAPGAGVADDKALYCLMPELINFYLGERPLLAPVPTYRCADPDECGPVLDRLDQLVTKPVDGYGGGGVLIGPAASRREIDERRRAIEADPAAWIGQEVVALSTHPSLTDGALRPRHVDLRAFVYLSGTGAEDAHLADIALTRVAPQGSMVVNSSRGGGAKDTWIIADPEEG